MKQHKEEDAVRLPPHPNRLKLGNNVGDLRCEFKLTSANIRLITRVWAATESEGVVGQP